MHVSRIYDEQDELDLFCVLFFYAKYWIKDKSSPRNFSFREYLKFRLLLQEWVANKKWVNNVAVILIVPSAMVIDVSSWRFRAFRTHCKVAYEINSVCLLITRGFFLFTCRMVHFNEKVPLL